MLYLSKSDLQKNTKLQRDWSTYYPQQADCVDAEVLKNFYQQPPPDPEAALSSVPMVALDLETTGLNWHQDSIVSIGLVVFSTARIRLNSAQYWVVKPLTLLNEESILVHNLTHSDMASASRLSDVLRELIPLLAGKIVVAHHASIERNFLSLAAQKAFESEWLFPIIDTMEIERSLTTNQRSWWNRLLQKTRPSLQLRECRSRYALPAYRQHHALNDAVACAELLQAQFSRLGENVLLGDVIPD